MVPSVLFLALLMAAACGGRDDFWDGSEPVDTSCRPNPRACFGEVGGDCVYTEDCSDGVCCREKECGGGQCAYLCRGDLDCPPAMACQHGFCFFSCTHDSDCGPGQKCKHDHTVCEYD